MRFRRQVEECYVISRRLVLAKDLDLTKFSDAVEWAEKNTDIDFENEREKESTEDRISNYMHKYQEVMKKSEIEIYRALCVPKKEDVNLKKLGTWWSFDKDGVGCYGADTRKGKVLVVLTALISSKAIDWETGFYSFLFYGEDQWECAVNEGAQVTVTHIDGEKLSKPLKSKA